MILKVSLEQKMHPSPMEACSGGAEVPFQQLGCALAACSGPCSEVCLPRDAPCSQLSCRAVLQLLCGFWLSEAGWGLVLSINLPSGAKQQLGVHFSANKFSGSQNKSLVET